MTMGLVMLLQMPVSAAQTSLNYGKGLTSDVTLTASQMYESMYGKNLSAAEKTALDALADVSMTYSKIPDSVIDREYDNGTLTILVESYEYVAQNGKTVLWVPESVSFNGGAKKTLQKRADGVYTCVYTGLTHTQTFNLDVNFYWQVDIEVEIANTLRTLPYTVGADAWGRLEPYATYQSQLKEYNDWMAACKQYPIDKAAYDAYVQAKREYDEKKSAYDAYIAAKAQYDADVIAYRENEAKKKAYVEAEKQYFAYEKLREQNAAVYDQYETYLREMDSINRALKIFDSVFAYEGNADVPWEYYLSIKGPTATSFLDTLQGQEHLTGINRALLDEARNASQTVKNLLVEYEKVSKASYGSAFERTVAKYAFYREHYTELCSSLKIFYLDMEAIYTTKGVPGLVDAKGKTKQMMIMIAQSYALYTALDDTVTMDPSWTLRSVPLNDILYEKHRLTDENNVSPDAVKIPEKEIELPSALMEPVPKPVKDYVENMSDPALKGVPVPVPNPGNPPAEVKEPTKPAEQGPDKPQGESPAKPNLTDVETMLAEAYRDNKLTERSLVQTAQKAKLYQTVSCKRSFADVRTVTFYGFDGEKLKEITVYYGQSLGYYKNQFPNPDKDGDERYSEYGFLGWVYFGTTNPTSYLDLESIVVTKDLAITPYYQTKIQKYEVVWRIPGKTSVTQWLTYWDTPVCPFDVSELSKEGNGKISYEFSGWERTQSGFKITYTAQYQKNAEEFVITWIVGDRTYTTKVLYGDLPDDSTVPKEIPPGDFPYAFVGWQNEHNISVNKPVTRDLTFVAKHVAQKPFAKYEDANGTEISCKAEHTASTVILRPEGTTVWFDRAIDYVLSLNEATAQTEGEIVLEIAWARFSVRFSFEDLKALKEIRCKGIALSREGDVYGDAVYYQIEFLNQMGSTLEYGRVLEMSISVSLNEGIASAVYADADGVLTEIDSILYNDGYLRFEAESDTRIFYQPRYQIKASDPTENSQLSAILPWASAGENVDLNVMCGSGYEVVGAILTYADGRTETIAGTSFLMPAEPISVELKVERMAFDISFVVDGVVYHEMRIYFGDKLVLPDAPTKAEDDRYMYSFAGWSPQVWNSAVYIEERNPVFTAVFTAHEKSGIVAESYRGSFLLRVILIGVGGMALAVGAILCIVHRKKVGPFIRRVIRGFVPFVRRCGSAIKQKTVAVWNAIRKFFAKRD